MPLLMIYRCRCHYFISFDAFAIAIFFMPRCHFLMRHFSLIFFDAVFRRFSFLSPSHDDIFISIISPAISLFSPFAAIIDAMIFFFLDTLFFFIIISAISAISFFFAIDFFFSSMMLIFRFRWSWFSFMLAFRWCCYGHYMIRRSLIFAMPLPLLLLDDFAAFRCFSLWFLCFSPFIIAARCWWCFRHYWYTLLLSLRFHCRFSLLISIGFIYAFFHFQLIADFRSYYIIIFAMLMPSRHADVIASLSFSPLSLWLITSLRQLSSRWCQPAADFHCLFSLLMMLPWWCWCRDADDATPLIITLIFIHVAIDDDCHDVDFITCHFASMLLFDYFSFSFFDAYAMLFDFAFRFAIIFFHYFAFAFIFIAIDYAIFITPLLPLRRFSFAMPLITAADAFRHAISCFAAISLFHWFSPLFSFDFFQLFWLRRHTFSFFLSSHIDYAFDILPPADFISLLLPPYAADIFWYLYLFLLMILLLMLMPLMMILRFPAIIAADFDYDYFAFRFLALIIFFISDAGFHYDAAATLSPISDISRLFSFAAMPWFRFRWWCLRWLFSLIFRRFRYFRWWFSFFFRYFFLSFLSLMLPLWFSFSFISPFRFFAFAFLFRLRHAADAARFFDAIFRHAAMRATPYW